MKLIRCECGFVARGDSDDQVVGMIRGHMATDHPALLDTVSRETWSAGSTRNKPRTETQAGHGFVGSQAAAPGRPNQTLYHRCRSRAQVSSTDP